MDGWMDGKLPIPHLTATLSLLPLQDNLLFVFLYVCILLIVLYFTPLSLFYIVFLCVVDCCILLHCFVLYHMQLLFTLSAMLLFTLKQFARHVTLRI